MWDEWFLLGSFNSPIMRVIKKQYYKRGLNEKNFFWAGILLLQLIIVKATNVLEMALYFSFSK